MGNSKAIGRRGRVLRRANERAQRRFHEACIDWRILREEEPVTALYLEAERLVDAIRSPEASALPVVDLEEILRGLRYEAYDSAVTITVPAMTETELRAMFGDR